MSIHLTNAEKLLTGFHPISLSEMDGVKLMRRTDTKFVCDARKVDTILKDAAESYRVLEINHDRAHKYETTYYDTDRYAMYVRHHNGLLNRYKVRSRKYLVSDIEFLEVKFKNNKGETVKTRVRHALQNPLAAQENVAFLNDETPYNAAELKPVLTNYFSRITLVHNTNPERVTMDLNLSFHNIGGGNLKMVPGICVIEVKRELGNRSSEIIDILKRNQVYPMGFSKYCIGTALVNKHVKANRFKPRFNRLRRFETTLHHS